MGHPLKGTTHDRADLVESNDLYNEQLSRYALFGSWHIDLYRFDNHTGLYEVLDNGGGGIIESFSTYGELVQWMITTHVLPK